MWAVNRISAGIEMTLRGAGEKPVAAFSKIRVWEDGIVRHFTADNTRFRARRCETPAKRMIFDLKTAQFTLEI